MSTTLLEKPSRYVSRIIHPGRSSDAVETSPDAPAAFSILETEARRLAEGDSSRELATAIDDTAERIYAALPPEQELVFNRTLGIKAVWSALHAWNLSRTEATEKLAVRTLANFRQASGHAALHAAFISARTSGNSIDSALDDYNANKL